MRDEFDNVWRLATATLGRAWMDARNVPHAADRIRKWAAAAERRRCTDDALKHLQAQPEILAMAHEFNRDPWLFNVGNGTIDLRTGLLREHRREDMLTMSACADYEPDAPPAARWLQFLDEIFDGDRELIGFLRRICGYALTGSVREQKFFILHGPGANGKTTFIDTLMYVMGDYAQQLAPDLLFSTRAAGLPAALASVHSRRLAVVAEYESDKRLAEARLKHLTGGDRLSARRGRRDSFVFRPTHTLFLCGNRLPVIRGTDHAIWRRICPIPFTVTIPEKRRDKDLLETLRAEATGILNWLVAGCLEWQERGLAEPEHITFSARAYRSDMDALGEFINDRCILAPDAQVTSADLNRAYRSWCAQKGERPLYARDLGIKLKERGLKSRRDSTIKRTRLWKGIGIVEK
jgi:putative DNA primase/helicase